VLLHYLVNSKVLTLLFCKHNKCKFSFFGHENEAVFIHLVFVDPGIKINGPFLSGRAAETGDAARCQCNFRRLLHFIMQNSAPANRARETVVLLQWQVPSCIAANLWPPNSPDLNTVDYKVWGTMQDHVYWAKVRDVDDLKHVWLMCRTVWSKASLTMRSTRGVYDFVPMSVQKGDIMNSVTCIWKS